MGFASANVLFLSILFRKNGNFVTLSLNCVTIPMVKVQTFAYQNNLFFSPP